VYVCAYRVNTRKRLARLGRADNQFPPLCGIPYR